MARLLRRSVQLGIVACLACAGPALADPPGRVARVSFLAGSVSFRPSSVSDWTDASLNYPLTIGDHIWTDVNARTELELGAMTVRLAPLSECSILNLDDRVVQLRITQGGIYVHVRARHAAEENRVDQTYVVRVQTAERVLIAVRDGSNGRGEVRRRAGPSSRGVGARSGSQHRLQPRERQDLVHRRGDGLQQGDVNALLNPDGSMVARSTYVPARRVTSFDPRRGARERVTSLYWRRDCRHRQAGTSARAASRSADPRPAERLGRRDRAHHRI